MRRRLTLKPWISRMQSELQEPESSGRTRVMTKVAFKQTSRPQTFDVLPAMDAAQSGETTEW